MKLTVLVENEACPGWACEHGLSLLLEDASGAILFDTGAGEALRRNLPHLRGLPERIRTVILSHGHSDHTGGLADILPETPSADLCFGAGIDRPRFSCHPGRPVKELTMPSAARAALAAHPAGRRHPITDFTVLSDDLLLTGPIPRTSGEECGGPFFLDREGTLPDTLAEETALLTRSGLLVHGCCHAGILNTLAHCTRHHPEIRIRTILGGLHLLRASAARLERTAQALAESGVERLILLHCTGSEALRYLRRRLPCEVLTLRAGESCPLDL